MNDLELKLPPVFVVLIIAIDMWLLSWIFASGLSVGWQFTSPNLLLWLSIAVGALLPVLGVIEFRKHKTTVNPMQPQESTEIVQTGIYRFTRNPMYLGFFKEYIDYNNKHIKQKLKGLTSIEYRNQALVVA